MLKWGDELLLDHAEDVILAQDQVLVFLDLDFGAAVLAEQDLVALLDIGRQHRAVVLDLALAGRDHFAHDRLFLGRVGDDDAALGLLSLFEPLHQNPVVQGTNL